LLKAKFQLIFKRDS